MNFTLSRNDPALAPCCQGCAHVPRCAAEELACRAFETFVCQMYPTGRHRPLPRDPNKEIFDRVFRKTDEEDLNENSSVLADD